MLQQAAEPESSSLSWSDLGCYDYDNALPTIKPLPLPVVSPPNVPSTVMIDNTHVDGADNIIMMLDVADDDDYDIDESENDSTCSIGSSTSSSSLSSSSSSSMYNMDDVSMGDDSDIVALNHHRHLQQQLMQKQDNKKVTKSVRFCDMIEMRNYNVVLSDHPLCDDGLAIELGWQYDPNDTDLIDLDTHEEYKSILESAYHQQNQKLRHQQQQRRGRGSGSSWSGRSTGLMGSTVQRRTTVEKQQLLHDVGGYTIGELQAAVQDAINKRHDSIMEYGWPLGSSSSSNTTTSSFSSSSSMDLVSLVTTKVASADV